MKPITVLLTTLLCALSLTGCFSVNTANVATNARNTKINATLDQVVTKTTAIAFGAVLNAAQSKSDSDTKTSFLQGLATGLRSQEGNLLTPQDVQALVTTWTPNKPHWLDLASQLAELYAQADPKTPAAAKTVIESIATGIDKIEEAP